MYKPLLKGKFYIWGTGKMVQQFYDMYTPELCQINVAGFIDNDTTRQGKMVYRGYNVYSPEILVEEKDAYLIIPDTYRIAVTEQVRRDYPWCVDRIVENLFFIRLQLLRRYKNSKDVEVYEIVNSLKNNKLRIFNYDFERNYHDNAEVFLDDSCGLYYVLFNQKRMYFARHYKNREEIITYYNSVLVEQDEKSPHYYSNVEPDSVICDCGVAEGNFTLANIDNIKKAYLFEPDPEWAEALRYTFMPYKDRVIIIEKSVSNYNDESTVRLDSVVFEDVNFLKMDVEGEEIYALHGAIGVLERAKKMVCEVCTYHQEFAYGAIEQFLLAWGFNVQPSYGYMWYPIHMNPLRPPVLRRGLIRGRKDRR